MAPPPEYDKEPKAPDKSVTKNCSEDSSFTNIVLADHQTNLDSKSTNSTANSESEKVENLNESQLQALLDECSAYKSPKDREGKSTLFKNLLKKAEKDNKAGEEAARGVNSRGACRRGVRGGGRRELAHSNSLQDVATLGSEPGPAHRHRRHHNSSHHHTSTVSARTQHGGSLPSGVDTSFHMFEECGRGSVGAEYVATVQCVNPSPHVERRVSASDDADLTRPVFTSIRTMDIGNGGGGCSGRAVTTTTASNQVDSAISFSCITTPEVVTSCNTTSSTSQSAVAVDAKPLQLSSCYRAVASITGHAPSWTQRHAGAQPTVASANSNTPATGNGPTKHEQPRSVISSSINGLLLSRPNYGSTGTTSTEEQKKTLDENGNSLQGYSSPLSGSSQHKKPRRKKSSKNETVINLHQIDGYQGNKDVNELLRFIEADNGRGQKLGRAKHKDDSDDKSGKKRSTERRKDKENKIKRASSLEELSRTKLEDLTDKPEPSLRKNKKERWTDGGVAKQERRSWGDDSRDAFYFEPEPDADFQTVTKKRKARRRPEDAACGESGSARRAGERAGAPVSDRSNDSNDDMDSVHSLPADAPLPPHSAVTSLHNTPPAPTAGAQPPTHVSYADIARTRHNIPDLIESCNYYIEGDVVEVKGVESGVCTASEETPHQPPPPAPAVADDGYPALDMRSLPASINVSSGNTVLSRRPRESKLLTGSTVIPTVLVRRKDRVVGAVDTVGAVETEGSVASVESPAPDVVSDRRPPVILLDCTTRARPPDMDGVTFGFDINEQLLVGSSRRPRCDLVRDAVESEAGEPHRPHHPHHPPAHTHQLYQIVDYVGNAWEDVVRCVGGKVRYFSE